MTDAPRLYVKTPQGWAEPTHVHKNGKWVPYAPSPAVREAMRRQAAAVPEPERAPVLAIAALIVGHAAVGAVCMALVTALVVMLS